MDQHVGRAHPVFDVRPEAEEPESSFHPTLRDPGLECLPHLAFPEHDGRDVMPAVQQIRRRIDEPVPAFVGGEAADTDQQERVRPDAKFLPEPSAGLRVQRAGSVDPVVHDVDGLVAHPGPALPDIADLRGVHDEPRGQDSVP